MMEPALIQACASGAVQLLSPFFKRVAQAGNDLAWQKAREFYAFLRQKLAGNQQAEDALDTMENEPDSAAAQEEVRQQLERAASTDEAFGRRLKALLDEVEAAGGKQAFKTNFYGPIANLMQVGAIHGSTVNVNFGQREPQP